MITARVLKGFRDYLPDTMLPKQRMLDRVAAVFESFGFAPLATPALEYADILLGKYGDEGDKLLYRFEDNGGRDVALRYDLTVPLARVIGQHRQLPRPFKRYQIAPVWRAEKPGRGRFREFLQCDVDIVGCASMNADAECLAVGAAVLDALGVERYELRINNRKLLSGLFVKLGLSAGDAPAILRSVDKLPKIGEASCRHLLAEENGLAPATVEGLFGFLGLSPGDLVSFFEGVPVGQQGAAELLEVIARAGELGVAAERLVVDLSIARGLDYYTGTIYETFLLDLESLGSVMSGGRYDELLSMFGGASVPAVGISLGVDRLFAGLTILDLVSARSGTPTRVLVTVFDPAGRSESNRIAAGLRAAGVPTEIYLTDRRLKKQLHYANQKQIPFVVIAGPEELGRGQVTLKNLDTGEQIRLPPAELPAHLGSHQGIGRGAPPLE